VREIATKNQRIFTQYGPDNFGTDDLARLAAALERLDAQGADFVLSYADCPEARDSFRRWRITQHNVMRHISGFAAHRKTSSELIFTNLGSQS